VKREVQAHCALRHPNIVPLLAVFHARDTASLIYQDAGPALEDYYSPWSEADPWVDGTVATAQQLLRDIGSALNYLHQASHVGSAMGRWLRAVMHDRELAHAYC